MAKVRYIGPHTDGAAVSVITDGSEYVVLPGEEVDLPDHLVFGVEPVLDDDDNIIESGVTGLLGLGHDTDGVAVAPEWELVNPSAQPVTDPTDTE